MTLFSHNTSYGIMEKMASVWWGQLRTIFTQWKAGGSNPWVARPGHKCHPSQWKFGKSDLWNQWHPKIYYWNKWPIIFDITVFWQACEPANRFGGIPILPSAFTWKSHYGCVLADYICLICETHYVRFKSRRSEVNSYHLRAVFLRCAPSSTVSP